MKKNQEKILEALRDYKISKKSHEEYNHPIEKIYYRTDGTVIDDINSYYGPLCDMYGSEVSQRWPRISND